MVNSETRVVIVGRQEIAREGLRRILVDEGFNVQTTATQDLDLNDCTQQAKPDLIIVEADTIDDGVDMCALLRASMPQARLVLITAVCDLESISRAFAVGVDGYLINTIACDPLVGALRLILMGEKVVPTQTVNALIDFSFPARFDVWDVAQLGVNLSDRETEILQRLVRGEANKLISRRLTISEATVKVHVKAILRKLHVLNRTQAAIWAVNRGLVSPEIDMPIPHVATIAAVSASCAN